MRIKRLLAVLLACAALTGMLVLPASAADTAAPTPYFVDIPDAETAEAAEILRLLDIVNGTGGGLYQPERTLTRAEFCTMAVNIMGNKDLVASQLNRTIFKDVPSSHWARGYIAVATLGSSSGSGENATTTPGIIRGDAYGYFYPDKDITFAEAVTILMRILGYTDTDVGFGSIWYDGYLSRAKAIELTEGVELSPEASLTRGQAARLMENLLYTEPNGSEDIYLKTKLGGSIMEDPQLILAVDGGDQKNEIKTSNGSNIQSYKTDRPAFSSDLVGRQAKLILDKDQKVLAVELSDKGTYRTVHLVPGELTYLKTDDGEEIKVAEDAVVWKDGKQEVYKDIYQNGIRSGDQALLYYNSIGELQYIFLSVSDVSKDTAMVAKNKPSGNPFGALTASDRGYKIYKNGVPAAAEDIRQYDTAVYDKGSKVLYVSDLRITGVFENVYPNAKAPTTLTVLGHEFPILDSAVADLAQFDIGDPITILLTYHGKIAGVVDPKEAKSTTVGVVTGIKNGYATVTPLADIQGTDGKKITFTGETSYTGNRAETMQGQLVTVSSSQVGRLSLSKLTGSGATAALDMATSKIGDTALADNVRFYERVGTSEPKEIQPEQITRGTVPASKILYVHKDSANKADIVLFDDVTGDQYQYGFLLYTAGETGEGMSAGTNPTVSVKNTAAPTGSASMVYASGQIKRDTPGGIVASLETDQSKTPKCAGLVTLTKVTDVKSADFDMDAQLVTVKGDVFPVSDFVECYNSVSKTWFSVPEGGDAMDALNAARAFSETLTVYYDKDPGEGGKIRLVVVE